MLNIVAGPTPVGVEIEENWLIERALILRNLNFLGGLHCRGRITSLMGSMGETLKGSWLHNFAPWHKANPEVSTIHEHPPYVSTWDLYDKFQPLCTHYSIWIGKSRNLTLIQMLLTIRLKLIKWCLLKSLHMRAIDQRDRMFRWGLYFVHPRLVLI